MDRIVIIGAGGHAASVADILLQNQEYDIAGCLDASFSESTPQFLNVGDTRIPVIGNDDKLPELYGSGIRYAFVALGSNRLRRKIFERIVGIGFTPVNVISGRSVISGTARLGRGICVMAGAVINVNAVIGDNCIINTNCSVDHDCVVGAHCHIAPGTAVSGTVHIGEGVQLGTGSSVIDKITIGDGSFIGAGAVVVKDIPSGVLAVGIPARAIKNI